eukprot:6185555-Pyramimonas_sp.AAC.1
MRRARAGVNAEVFSLVLWLHQRRNASPVVEKAFLSQHFMLEAKIHETIKTVTPCPEPPKLFF